MKNEFKVIADLIERNTRVLDVGCADGVLMEFLRAFKKSGTSSKKESCPLSDFISTNPTSAPIEFKAITISLFS